MRVIEASMPQVGRVLVAVPRWHDKLMGRRECVYYMDWGASYATDECWSIPRDRWVQLNKLVNDCDYKDTETSRRRLKAFAELVGKKVKVHAHGSA